MGDIYSKERGLLGINSAIQGAVQGFYDAQNQKYRQMEMEAKIKAQEKDKERQAFMDSLALREKGYKVAEGGDIYSQPLEVRDLTPQELSAKKEQFALKGMEAQFGPKGEFVSAKYRPDYMDMMRQKQALQTGGVVLTPAQKKVDETFGKEYANWRALGGFAAVKRNLEDVKGVIDELKKSDKISGPVVGAIPDFAKPLVAPKSKDIKDRISRIIMQSLKATLGGQFSEEEGKRLIDAAYNENLEERENISRLEQLAKEIEANAAAKEAASNYYEQAGGTLQGFKPTTMMAEQPAGLLQNTPQGLVAPKGGLVEKTNSVEPKKLSGQDKQALKWAKKNSNDPRAQQILQMLGQ